MQYSKNITFFLLCHFICLLSHTILAQNNCDDPLSLDWLQFSLGDPCVEGIYAFEYNGDDYVYLTSKPECIAADASNILYNCNDESFCNVFGFTPPEDQCDGNVQEAITPLLTDENLIFPLQNNSRACENPLELSWVKESLLRTCTDGIYAFEHEGQSYIYRSTACEYVDDPNTLYNCDNAKSCFVDGKTLPDAQCTLIGFPLSNYLNNQNLIWSSPLLRLLPEYEWLSSKVNFKQCDDVEIKEYRTANANYVSIKSANTTELFAQNGSLLCSNVANLNCEAAYGLTTPNEEWACNARVEGACGIDEPLNTLPWLQQVIDETPCDCNASIIQYCYKGAVYFDSSPLNQGYCADYAGFIADAEGNVICQNGGFSGGDCFQVLPDFYQTAENIGLVWSCNDNCGCVDFGSPVCGADGNEYDSACSATCAGVSEVPCDDNSGCKSLQFTSLNSACECCNDIILFEITGGDGNYEVSTLYGQAITNGMGTGIFSIGANEIIVTDGQGCTATDVFNNFPICCEVPPICELITISYNCVNGLQINGEGDCNSIAIKDQNENIYNHGDFLNEGTYTFTEAYQGQVSPPCIVSSLTVNCQDDSVCNLLPDSGPCDAYLPRYYYNTEAGECMQFIYGGCQGNDNNYETYEICVNSCGYNYSCTTVENPLQIAWIQKITENANGCSVRELIQFTYNNNIYFKTTPGWSGGFCPSDMPVHYYNCNGLRLCSQGFTPFPTCNEEMVAAASAEGSVIWTYGEDEEACDIEEVVITSNPDLCGNGIVNLITNDVFGNAGPDDSEIAFVKVQDNNTFEVLVDEAAFEPIVCFYAVAYRLSCGAPDFSTNNFQDVLDNAGDYKVSECFTINYIQAPEFQISTEPYCSADGLFTVGVTINGGSGSYIVGQDYTGENVFGETGENFITFASGQQFYDIYPIDAETGCANDYIILIEDPDCGSLNVCELPMLVGPCEALIPRYYYDAEQRDCIEFFYGGCNGNANNFETYEVCLEACGGGNEGCEDPFELEIVQNAINNPSCTEAIYAFSYQNNDYVFFKSACEAIDLPSELYNCNTGLACGVGGLAIPVEGCDELFYQVSNLINDENIIWQPEEGCACDDDYTPVCGVDGNTYSNTCQAECEGVEIAYEGECARVDLNCSTGNPLQWLWIQNLITEYGGCLVTEIQQFTYQGTQHFRTVSGYPQNLTCPTDAPSTYYNCEGNSVCITGFLPPDSPNFCDENIRSAANNASAIWTYNETNCADPFELQLVENAIADETCTGGIYAFNFEGESFLYVQTLCEFIDAPNVLYNCNKGTSCYIGGETIFVEACYKQYDEISSLINKENLIWTKPCEYEYSGTVIDRSDSEDCGLLIEMPDDTILEPTAIPNGFTLRDGQTVEFTFRSVPIGASCPIAEKAEIICIREVEEGCACDADYTPVCGVDGNTYSNACQAACEGVEIAFEGECEELCICPAVYEPVCGLDGKTYGNECEAACEGVEIDYTGECVLNNNSALLNTYSWLNNMVNFYGYCENGLTVTEYAWSDTYSFVYIQWPDGIGQLYYQDSTYYCTDAEGYSCLEVYSLTNEVDSWTCNQPNQEGPNEVIEITFDEITCKEDGTFTIDLSATGALSESYGLYHAYSDGQPNFIYFKEGESISFEGNVADAENGMFTAYIYDQYLADAAAKAFTIDVSDCRIMPSGGNDQAIFNQYTWLSEIVNPDDCTPGYEITEYDFGSYSFLYVKTNNTGELYLGDGTYYCGDASGFSCVEAYGFTNPSASTGCNNVVDCPNVLQPVCGTDGNTYDNACQAEKAGVSVAYEGACTSSLLFSQYTWLNDLITEGDCNAGNMVSEYDFGSYSFVYVQTNSLNSLYLNDGTFYCTDAPEYSCVDLYGFSQASAVWSCEEGFMRKEQSNNSNTHNPGHLKIEQDFNVYPNPSKGKFRIALINPKQIFQTINILNIEGQLQQTIQIENHQPFVEVDLTGIAKGIYLVQLQSADYMKTQKMVIH